MKKSEFIVQDLLSKIYQRQFPEGKLPAQRALAEAYGVSRFTVQEAVRILSDVGVIDLVQGSGMFVREQFRINPLIFNSVTRAPYRTIVSKCLEFVMAEASDEECQVFQLRRGSKMWHYMRLRIINGAPEQVEVSSLPASLFPDFNPGCVERSVQAYVERSGYRISHYMTEYAPHALTKAESQLLMCRRSTPSMRIANRGILSSGRVFETSEVVAIDYAVSYIRPYDREIHRARMESMDGPYGRDRG